MAIRIVGVDLPQNKRGEVALTYIYGIGRSAANTILAKAGIDRDIKVQDWTDDQAAKVREIIGAEYKVEGDLRSEVQLNIKRLMDNITSNLVKYANPAQAISVAMTAENEEICFTVTNAVSPEASSQTSSGIGLSNMRAMMEKMMGTLETVQTEEVFRVTLRFPLADTRTLARNNAEDG